MAYHYEDTGKEALIREINKLAKKLNQYVEFDPIWMIHYEDLVDLKCEMTAELMGGKHAHKIPRENKI